MADKYDSTMDTLNHIMEVQKYLFFVSRNLKFRAAIHDQSKLSGIEKKIFDEWTPKLAGVDYGTPEYYDMLKELKPALDHHYANNSHHPQHFPDGVEGMNLLDLVEMFCDWMAATKRHDNGDIRKSIAHNEKRFNISPQLSKIFLNTVETFEENNL